MILVSGHDDAENYDIVLKLREIKWSMSSLSNLRAWEEKILLPMMMVWLFGDSARFMSGYVGGGVSRALKTPADRPRLLSRSDQLASPSVRLGHYSTKVDVKIISSQCLEKSDRKKVAPKSTNSAVDERLSHIFLHTPMQKTEVKPMWTLRHAKLDIYSHEHFPGRDMNIWSFGLGFIIIDHALGKCRK